MSNYIPDFVMDVITYPCNILLPAQEGLMQWSYMSYVPTWQIWGLKYTARIFHKIGFKFWKYQFASTTDIATPRSGKLQSCQGYTGYFWSPHWKSVGLQEIFRVTWQLRNWLWKFSGSFPFGVKYVSLYNWEHPWLQGGFWGSLLLSWINFNPSKHK